MQMAGNNPPFPVKVVRKENLVALIVGYRNANDLAAVVKGKPLSGNATFQKSLAQVGKEPVAAVYIDVDAARTLLERFMRQGGQANDVANPISTLDQRLDLVLVAGGIRPVSIERVGHLAEDRTPSGLWPSDHAGLVADLEVD